jgi:hypothetical protein
VPPVQSIVESLETLVPSTSIQARASLPVGMIEL